LAPDRLVTWAGLRDAVGYRVELFLGSARVFSADARRPALSLPASWTFGGRRHRLAAGDYRVYVWAAVPGRPTPVLVVRSRPLR
jgi:hypothetical protein